MFKTILDVLIVYSFFKTYYRRTHKYPNSTSFRNRVATKSGYKALFWILVRTISLSTIKFDLYEWIQYVHVKKTPWFNLVQSPSQKINSTSIYIGGVYNIYILFIEWENINVMYLLWSGIAHQVFCVCVLYLCCFELVEWLSSMQRSNCKRTGKSYIRSRTSVGKWKCNLWNH